jgi:hypothetical protein
MIMASDINFLLLSGSRVTQQSVTKILTLHFSNHIVLPFNVIYCALICSVKCVAAKFDTNVLMFYLYNKVIIRNI